MPTRAAAPTCRVLRNLTAGALVAVAVACAGGGARSRVATPPPLVAADAGLSLEGEWRLTALQLADGVTRKVNGYLRFDRFSNMTVHAELAPDEPAARPPRTVVADFTAKASAANGEFEFVGLSMNVGAERLTADAVTMAEWRHYALTGSTLRVSVRDRAGRTAATLVFER